LKYKQKNQKKEKEKGNIIQLRKGMKINKLQAFIDHFFLLSQISVLSKKRCQIELVKAPSPP
jgi:hypothetical protein